MKVITERLERVESLSRSLSRAVPYPCFLRAFEISTHPFCAEPLTAIANDKREMNLSRLQIRVIELAIGAIEAHDFVHVVLGFAETDFGGEDAGVFLV